MKIKSLKLVYFSPTGATKNIIERIAHKIDQSNVEIIDITKPEGRKRQLKTLENELLIIGVPVYYGRVPINAIEWLRTIEAHKTPTVCVVVYGNREIDDALLELKDTAVNSGCLPIACAAYVGEHSFSNAEIPIAAGRPNADDIKHAESFGVRIKEKLLSTLSVGQINSLAIPGNYPYRNASLLSPDDFIAVDENCLKCGVCAQVCPVGAIDPENGKASDRKNVFAVVLVSKAVLPMREQLNQKWLII